MTTEEYKNDELDFKLLHDTMTPPDGNMHLSD